jgi:hypothetical protein
MRPADAAQPATGQALEMEEIMNRRTNRPRWWSKIARALQETEVPPERDPSKRPAMDTLDDWILFGPRMK